MAGGFTFARSGWTSGWSAVYYVMRFLAERVEDPATRDEINERMDNNVPFLNLSDPDQGPLVDIIANDLMRDGPPVSANPEYQAAFTQLMVELVDCAREQQDYNRDPTGPSYYRLGPGHARFFDLDRLANRVSECLQKYDCVRIDVRYYTAEQRATIRDHLAALGGSRVSIVGDDAVGQDGN
jgi:hypothetical protein